MHHRPNLLTRPISKKDHFAVQSKLLRERPNLTFIPGIVGAARHAEFTFVSLSAEAFERADHRFKVCIPNEFRGCGHIAALPGRVHIRARKIVHSVINRLDFIIRNPQRAHGASHEFRCGHHPRGRTRGSTGKSGKKGVPGTMRKRGSSQSRNERLHVSNRDDAGKRRGDQPRVVGGEYNARTVLPRQSGERPLFPYDAPRPTEYRRNGNDLKANGTGTIRRVAVVRSDDHAFHIRTPRQYRQQRTEV